MLTTYGIILQVATLEQQVANLERQRQQEASSLRASSEHVQREMQGHCSNLQAQLDAVQVSDSPIMLCVHTHYVMHARHYSMYIQLHHCWLITQSNNQVSQKLLGVLCDLCNQQAVPLWMTTNQRLACVAAEMYLLLSNLACQSMLMKQGSAMPCLAWHCFIVRKMQFCTTMAKTAKHQISQALLLAGFVWWH